MNQIDPAQNLLNTLQTLRAQAQNLEIARPSPQSEVDAAGSPFAELLGRISGQQARAGEMMAQVERGEEGASLVETMVAMNRSRISFEALKQVRNKALSAYQDIMNMPV